MTVIFVLIGISICIATGFLAAFVWSVNSGQYDDNYSPAVRILFDDKIKPAVSEKSKTEINKTTNHANKS